MNPIHPRGIITPHPLEIRLLQQLLKWFLVNYVVAYEVDHFNNYVMDFYNTF